MIGFEKQYLKNAIASARRNDKKVFALNGKKIAARAASFRYVSVGKNRYQAYATLKRR